MTVDREAGADEEVASDEPVAEDLQAVYDRIAAHFSKTREYAWPEVESFISDEVDRCDSLDRALDLGCGNGRHAQVLAEAGADVSGLDVSRGLLNEARQRASDHGFAVDLVHGDASRVPFIDDQFSQIVYVATLHHLRTREARRQSLSEVGRVLAPGGRALVSAWSTAHDRFEATKGFDTTVDWTLPGGKQVGRYYHIYDPQEFRADLEAASVEIVDVRVSSGNCYGVVAPPSDDV
jgi:ubiquinone/menaquinone biosynthesis C-methylase UbiE